MRQALRMYVVEFWDYSDGKTKQRTFKREKTAKSFVNFVRSSDGHSFTKLYKLNVRPTKESFMKLLNNFCLGVPLPDDKFTQMDYE